MTIEEWDAYIDGLADNPAFILDSEFKEGCGEMLARILATGGWPDFPKDRVYAKAGDNSNHALRKLQRKYEAALKIIAAAEEAGEHARDPQNSV